MVEKRLSSFIESSLAAWHHFISTNLADDLLPLLAEEIVFRSPVAHEPYPGREAAILVLTTANSVFQDFRYHRECVSADGLNVVLEFEAKVNGRELKGIDFIRFDAVGKITEFEVMVRPLSGLKELASAMNERLASKKKLLSG